MASISNSSDSQTAPPLSLPNLSKRNSEEALEKTGDIISGSRYSQEVYTLYVGPSRHIFAVHKVTLCESPVFACMCDTSFAEGVSKEITLPEDNADSFGRVLEHLYGRNDVAFEMSLVDFEAVDKLTDMYGLAEKYDLPDLKVRIVEELKLLDILNERLTFFTMAHKIFQITNDSDTIFEPYFTEQAKTHLKATYMEEDEEIADIMALGGIFARKVFLLQVAVGEEKTSDWKLAKAERMHRSQHVGCHQCHVLL